MFNEIVDSYLKKYDINEITIKEKNKNKNENKKNKNKKCLII